MQNSSVSNPTITRKIWDLLNSTERRSAVLLLGLMFIGMALETLGVGLIIPAIAFFTQSDYANNYPSLQPLLVELGNPSQKVLVIVGMLVLVAVYLIKTIFLAFLAWRQMSFAFGVQAQISQRLFTVYLHQPYTFHLQRNSAQLIRNVTGEVNTFTFNTMLPGMSLLTEALVLFGLCILLLVVEPMGALIVVSVLGISAWGFHRLTRSRITRWGEARQYHEGLRIQHLQQGLGGAKDVKVLGRESEFLEQYRLHNVQSARAWQFQATLQQLPRLWMELLAVCGLATLVLTMLVQGHALEVILPTLGLFAAAAFRLMPSANRILSAVQSMRYGLPVIDTLHAELELASPTTPVSHKHATPFRDALELDKVSYTYPGAPAPALNELSLSIRCGESVGFIGASGAGKSTLVDILLGLLTPTVGEVRVDGVGIGHALRNWQDQIGYVPQSIFLTDDTLRRNVAFGIPNEQIEEAEVWRAIHAAQMDEFVQSLPQGLDTLVGERGIRLSGGQRQRIGIARALYHDPEVLVLDEATSSLDVATERDVMNAVRALQGAKTILIVAHRLSTVKQCNRLFRLKRGSIVNEGTPATLLVSETGK